MDDAVDHIDGLAVGGGMRGFEAASLVNSHVDEHGSLLHQAEHVLGDELGCSVTGYEHRADDDVDGGQFLANVMFGAVERVDVGRHLGCELLQTWQRDISDGDIRTHAGSNACGGFTHGTTA